MNFAFAILIYLVFFLIFLYVFSKYGMGLFSALTLTSLLCALILLAILPPSDIDEQINIFFSDVKHKRVNDWVVLIYIMIGVLTLLLISAYVVSKAFEDRHRRVKVYNEEYLCDFDDYLKFW
jgi:hypothetical protein